jgi:hypothetical protein
MERAEAVGLELTHIEDLPVAVWQMRSHRVAPWRGASAIKQRWLQIRPLRGHPIEVAPGPTEPFASAYEDDGS